MYVVLCRKNPVAKKETVSKKTFHSLIVRRLIKLGNIQITIFSMKGKENQKDIHKKKQRKPKEKIKEQ